MEYVLLPQPPPRAQKAPKENTQRKVIPMKQRRLLSLLLALALLAGCAPAAEPPASPSPTPVSTSTPTPEPTPTPAPEPTHAPEPVDFREFLDGVNAARKAIATREEPIELPAEYTPDFSGQNHTFTEEEMERLTTPHEAEENLDKEGLLADVDTFFLLLQTTYGAYYYFGGDDVFLPIRDAVKEELASLEKPTVRDLDDILYKHLSPVLVDGHFSLESHAMRTPHAQYMYYVPNLYLDSAEGAENPDYIKPTIGPDGRICYWYAALSHDGSDLPDTLDGNPLNWNRAFSVNVNGGNAPAFSESEWEGVPVLTSRSMRDRGENADASKQALQRLADCGGEYADSPLLIFDLRDNSGGNDKYINNWFRDWSGAKGGSRSLWILRYSQLSCRLFSHYSANYIGAYHVFSSPATWADRSGPVFVLQDKGVASSGESAVENFRTAADVLFVGGPTLGCALTPNNIRLYLPHSGLSCYFGTGLAFCETDENRDGVGFLPDLWVAPAQAMVLTKKLIEYYGLNVEP